MRKFTLYLVSLLLLTGCVTSSKAVKPTSRVETPPIRDVVIKKPVVPIVSMPPLLARDIPLEISYSQITNMLEEFIEMKEEGASGEERLVGSSENNLVILEIIGPKNNIRKASLRLVYPSDIETIDADLNNAMMLRFLKNVAPESGDWLVRLKGVLEKFSSIQADTTQQENIVVNDRLLRILYDKKARAITLTLEHK